MFVDSKFFWKKIHGNEVLINIRVLHFLTWLADQPIKNKNNFPKDKPELISCSHAAMKYHIVGGIIGKASIEIYFLLC